MYWLFVSIYFFGSFFPLMARLAVYAYAWWEHGRDWGDPQSIHSIKWAQSAFYSDPLDPGLVYTWVLLWPLILVLFAGYLVLVFVVARLTAIRDGRLERKKNHADNP